MLNGMVTDPDILAAQSLDLGPELEPVEPVGLVRARSVGDVVETMRYAHRHGIPVVPQGARTSLTGSSAGVDGCLLLDLTRMNRILEVDGVNMTVTVEPGIINKDLKDALRPHGLAYPPDPGSFDTCTIGGNIATNAGGMCCVKYGVTSEYVREITVVLADGTVTRLGHRTVKGVAGLDLAGLFTGSEGTLGVIVSATLKVVPLGEVPLTSVGVFANERDAAVAVARTMETITPVPPSMLELIDGVTIGMLNELGNFGLEPSAGAILIMQADSPTAATDIGTFAGVAESCGAVDVAVSDDPADGDALVAARRLVHQRCRAAPGGCLRAAEQTGRLLRRVGRHQDAQRTDDQRGRPRRRREHPPRHFLRPELA